MEKREQVLYSTNLFGNDYFWLIEANMQRVLNITNIFKPTNNCFAEDTDSRILNNIIRQLDEYFAGKRQEFDITYILEGTEFQKQVWQQMLQIPYGETKTYGEIAKIMQHDKAVRAVGGACGKNKLSIIIPCHRIVGKSSLTGFTAAEGIKLKAALLMHEQKIKENQITGSTFL